MKMINYLELLDNKGIYISRDVWNEANAVKKGHRVRLEKKKTENEKLI